MPLKLTDILWLISFPALMSVGQILFRASALNVSGRPLKEMIFGLLFMPSFNAALVVYGFTTLLWVWLLSRYPLSLAYPFATLAVLVVPIIEMLIYQKPLSSGYWVGLALIFAGVLVVVHSKG